MSAQPMLLNKPSMPVTTPETTTHFLVTEIHSDDEAHVTQSVFTDGEELVGQRSPARANVGHFAWLEFALPEGNVVRALGEVIGRSVDTTRYRFKHIWPRDRVRMSDFLANAVSH